MVVATAPTTITAATIPPISRDDTPSEDALLAGEHTAFDVALHAVVVVPGHCVHAAHTRSVVSVGANIWYSVSAHSVTGVHVRCDVVVGATVSNVLPTTHCVMLAQTPPGATPSTPGPMYCHGRQLNAQRRSDVGVGAAISTVPAPLVQLATGTHMPASVAPAGAIAAYVPAWHCCTQRRLVESVGADCWNCCTVQSVTGVHTATAVPSSLGGAAYSFDAHATAHCRSVDDVGATDCTLSGAEQFVYATHWAVYADDG